MVTKQREEELLNKIKEYEAIMDLSTPGEATADPVEADPVDLDLIDVTKKKVSPQKFLTRYMNAPAYTKLKSGGV